MPRKAGDINPRAFLKAYSATANITQAAKAAGIDTSLHYRWLETSEKYAAAFREAERAAGDFLESVAVQRATEGVVEAVYYQGRPVGAVKRYSDGVMMTLLRGFKPQKYANRTELSGPEGGPIELVQRLNAARDRINREDLEAANKREAEQKARKSK